MFKLFTPLLTSIALLSSASVHAKYDTVFADLAQGEEMTHVRIGLGETPRGAEGEKVTSMLFLSYFASEDTLVRDGINQGTQDVEILALGAGGFGYLEHPTKQGGAEFDFELSKTTIDSQDYDRTGLGFRAQLFLPVAGGLQSNIGFNIRPFFLSPDWDDQAQLEYEYQAGLEYAFNWDAALYAHYRYIALIDQDEKELKLAEGAIMGLRFRF